MSKAHMVVLSFVGATPMHGYQIGQLVEKYDLPHWTGVTLPSIYKAMQSLEKLNYIRGEEMREGNNPPRKVYQLNPKGRDYLRRIVCGYLREFKKLDLDWWMALFFARKTMRKEDFLELLEERIAYLKQVRKAKQSHRGDESRPDASLLPFIHDHILTLSDRYLRSELRTLQEVVAAVKSGARDDFFVQEGEEQ